jgi:hypothetical protein
MIFDICRAGPSSCWQFQHISSLPSGFVYCHAGTKERVKVREDYGNMWWLGDEGGEVGARNHQAHPGLRGYMGKYGGYMRHIWEYGYMGLCEGYMGVDEGIWRL